MTNQLNFEELEAKTSGEFVAEIKRHLVDHRGRVKTIKSVDIDHFKSDTTTIEAITVLLIVENACYEFYFDCNGKRFSHRWMHIDDIKKLSEMYDEYEKTLGA